MRGEEYLSRTKRKRLDGHRHIIVDAYNRYFPVLFSLDNFNDGIVDQVLREAMKRGESNISGSCLEIHSLNHKACRADMYRNPILVVT